MGSDTLTTQELTAMVDNQCNLTDAHPRYTPLATQEKILEQLSVFFMQARERSYKDIAEGFKNSFYFLAAQKRAFSLKHEPMFCYSASLCIQITASYLRSAKLRVALLEPAFDNVTGILKAEKIDVIPLPEEQLETIDTFLEQNPLEAIWLTLPNNPTGKYLSKKDFI